MDKELRSVELDWFSNIRGTANDHFENASSNAADCPTTPACAVSAITFVADMPSSHKETEPLKGYVQAEQLAGNLVLDPASVLLNF